MVDPYELIGTRIKSISAIGTEVGEKIYNNEVPKKAITGPLIKLTKIDGPRTYKGLSGHVLMQISIHDKDESTVRRVQEAVIAELVEWSGDINGTWASIVYLTDGIFPADTWWNGTIDLQLKYIEE